MIKKIARAVFYRILDRYFWQGKMPALRFLYKRGLDIPLYVVPFFLLHNLDSLIRLRRLKKAGHSPAIIYWSMESDGRFDRPFLLSREPSYTDAVWFRFPIRTAATEAIIFEEHTKRGCGFYEDARMKYIQPENDQARENYRNYLVRFLDALEKWTGKIDFFLSGSNHDRYVAEMVVVAQNRGTSFVVAEREGTGTEYTYENEAKCFKNSKGVTAHYILTANEGHKYMFDYSRQPSVREVSVIGELDTDFWFHWNRQFTRKQYQAWNGYAKKVLFLTFGTRNYIESYAFPNNPEMNWCLLLKEAEEGIFEFAKSHPDILVFYKMGHKEDNNAEFIKLCENHGLNNVVPLDRSFPCHELILYCGLTIGFQTTAMFEAMFSDHPLFYLYWAIPSCVDKKTQMLPLADSGACTVIDSKEKFKESLEKWASNDPSIVRVSESEKRNRIKTRTLMFKDADGAMAERFLKKLSQLVHERRRPADAYSLTTAKTNPSSLQESDYSRVSENEPSIRV